MLTADQGSDKLSVFSLSNGELTVAGRCEVTAGSGPSSMVLDPDGKRLYVAHALNGSVSSFGYDATLGRILDRRQTVWASVAGEMAALAMHPSGEMLYSSHGDGVQAWKIRSEWLAGDLPGVEGIQAIRLHVTADGKSLLALSSDAVLRMKIDASALVLAALSRSLRFPSRSASPSCSVVRRYCFERAAACLAADGISVKKR